MKLFNYDPLQLKNTNENTSSFWLKSSVKKSSMKNQFWNAVIAQRID